MQRAISALVAVLLLSACAQVGLQPAQSFDERLAYAYGANTAVREASVSALDAGSISAEDMEHVIALSDQARSLLDAARVASGAGDLGTAESRLALATSVLTQLQTYLRERQ